MTHRTWQDNAEEFGALTKQGVDVRLAALVACSVEKGKAGRPAIGSIEPIKTSMALFAAEAGTGRERINRHLAAWEKCAANGWCKPAADLTPDDVNATEVPTQAQFAGVFDATASGGRPRDSKPEDAAQIIEKRGAEPVVKAMTKAQRDEMTAELRKAEVEDIELETMARGGRVPSLDEINRDAGNHPLDGAVAHASAEEEGLRLLLAAKAQFDGIAVMSPRIWEQVSPALMSIADKSPSAVTL